ncbi:hypothetical protein BDV98DRAFT_565729 [Pterulicium gracile]|uniref:Uncharacterized protein n=1 Tax=Pterulicium gracile TaxID=1884261 RepID=A0A5C3QKT4_9AGAR|nr:hypothetical protein BDV98DRAFT_565729 [Pterula gracilis]
MSLAKLPSCHTRRQHQHSSCIRAHPLSSFPFPTYAHSWVPRLDRILFDSQTTHRDRCL